MNEVFEGTNAFVKGWTATDDRIIYKGKEYYYKDLKDFRLASTPLTPLSAGQIQSNTVAGKQLILAFKASDKPRAHKVIQIINEKINEANGIVKDYIFNLTSHTGTRIEVYNDYLILFHMPVGSHVANILRGGDIGGKRINFDEITAIQYREPDGTVGGFMQFAYPGAIQSKGGALDKMSDENTFPIVGYLADEAREIYEFIEKRRNEIKRDKEEPEAPVVIQEKSPAEQIKEFKELLDLEIITQEEFDAKKKQLLGL